MSNLSYLLHTRQFSIPYKLHKIDNYLLVQKKYTELLQAENFLELYQLCKTDIDKLKSYFDDLIKLIRQQKVEFKLFKSIDLNFKDTDFTKYKDEAHYQDLLLAIKELNKIESKTKNSIQSSKKRERTILLGYAQNLFQNRAIALQFFSLATKNLILKNIESKSLLSNSVNDDINIIATSINSISKKHSLLLKRLYLLNVSNDFGKLDVLHDFINWAIEIIENVSRIELSLQLLLDDKRKTLLDLEKVRILKLKFETNQLLRALIASDISSHVAIVSFFGLSPNNESYTKYRQASTKPFHGSISVGKKAHIARLQSLPSEMFVRVEGRVSDIKNVGDKFIANLNDFSNLSKVSISGQNTLLKNGIFENTYIQLSGILKESKLKNKSKNIEISNIQIKEIYSNDIWKIAFYDLAFPYFLIWPDYQHINVLTSSSNSESSSNANIYARSGPCEELLDKLNEASQSLTDAQNDYYNAYNTVIAFMVSAAAAIATAPLGWWTLAGIITGLAAANNALDTAKDKWSRELNDYNNALQNYNDCKEHLTDNTPKGEYDFGPFANIGFYTYNEEGDDNDDIQDNPFDNSFDASMDDSIETSITPEPSLPEPSIPDDQEGVHPQYPV